MQSRRCGLTLIELVFFLVSVAAVGVTWGMVRTRFGTWCGILAGAFVAVAFAVFGLWANERAVRSRLQGEGPESKPETGKGPNQPSQPIAGKPGSG